MSQLERIAYSDGETALTGWLARPDGEQVAAVAVFPTIANLTESVADRARRLADLGYIALVGDFYGDAVGDSPDYMALAEALRADPSVYRARIGATIAKLRELAGDLPVLAIGHCMGGQAVLEAARAGEAVLAVVSFHGLLSTDAPADKGSIGARILVCHGDADPLVTREDVQKFWAEMDRAGADWHLHSYGRVRHGFTDPASDARGVEAVRYDASADRQSWAAMISFFDEVLESA